MQNPLATAEKLAPSGAPDRPAIEAWLIDRVARMCQLAPHEIDPTAPHSDYGLDSMSAVLIAADLEDWLEIEVSPTVSWDFPTIAALAAHLAAKVGR